MKWKFDSDFVAKRIGSDADVEGDLAESQPVIANATNFVQVHLVRYTIAGRPEFLSCPIIKFVGRTNLMNIFSNASRAYIAVVLLGIAGCGEPRPEGLPELHPTLITITQEGQPLADASVSLIPEDTSLSRWPVGGTTDSSGVAKITTFNSYEGAPAGKFKVTVNKIVTTGDPLPTHPGVNATPEELREYDRAMKTGKYEVFKVVASKFRLPGTTTLEVNVAGGGATNQTLDVEDAVKEKDAAASTGGRGDNTYHEMGAQ